MTGYFAGSTASVFPPLPLEDWEDSKETLHRYAQFLGKIRVSYTPSMNNCWHVTL